MARTTWLKDGAVAVDELIARRVQVNSPSMGSVANDIRRSRREPLTCIVGKVIDSIEVVAAGHLACKAGNDVCLTRRRGHGR